MSEKQDHFTSDPLSSFFLLLDAGCYPASIGTALF
jgi:hypothetical protein